MKFFTTIAACSTGFPAAIAVIRISGDDALRLLSSCFFVGKNNNNNKTEENKTNQSKASSDFSSINPANQSKALDGFSGINKENQANQKGNSVQTVGQPLNPIHRHMLIGTLDLGGIRDKATAVFFCAPHSYTGEDMAEITIHGSPALADRLMTHLITHGAVAAERGEFTKRAFLNGKLDLSSAEGVLNLINAQTDSQLRAAYGMMQGEIRAQIEPLQAALSNTIAAVEAAIDFPEEDLEAQTKQQTLLSTEKIGQKLSALVSTFKGGRLIKDGVKIALIGGVNVGKSSLLNALVGKDRAIVSDVAGTTRDVVEDSFAFGGYKFIVCDTAGLRKHESLDQVERLGIKRSILAIEESDIVLAVSEAGKPLDSQAIQALLSDCGEGLSADGVSDEGLVGGEVNKKIVLRVENKLDIYQNIGNNPDDNNPYNSDNEESTDKQTGKLGKKIDQSTDVLMNEAEKKIEEFGKLIKVSAKTGDGIDGLKEQIFKASVGTVSVGPMITEMRHFQAINECIMALESAQKNMEFITMDCLASELMAAYNSLGKITGLVGSDDIINEIFSRFCVGK